MNHNPHPWAKTYIWRIDAPTRAKLAELEKLAEGLEQDDPTALQLQDEMRCLKGYPVEAQLWDIIELEPEFTAYSFPTSGKVH